MEYRVPRLATLEKMYERVKPHRVFINSALHPSVKAQTRELHLSINPNAVFEQIEMPEGVSWMDDCATVQLTLAEKNGEELEYFEMSDMQLCQLTQLHLCQCEILCYEQG